MKSKLFYTICQKRYWFILVTFFLCFNLQAHAQQKYLDSLYAFSNIKKSTHTYIIKSDEELQLDLFDPVMNEDTQRPLILYVHGGGFSGGERDYPNQNAFLRHLSSKGYVTATMSYTLHMKGQSFGCNQPAPKKIETFLKTARDINRAAAFLIANSSKFSIDTKNIVIVGSSAGAEAVLHAAYWDAARMELDKNTHILPYDFTYGGVISMAGAISNIKLITEESAIPTQLFHGTCDTLVPYGEAPHHYCDTADPGYLTLYGAESIAQRFERLNKGFYLVTGCNGGHEWASSPLQKDRKEITDFIYYDVLKGQHRQIRYYKSTGKPSCNQLTKAESCEITNN